MNHESPHEDLGQLSDRIGELLDRLEAHPDENVRGDVVDLLQNVDMLHREAFSRLLDLVKARDLSLAAVSADPVLRVVLALYDLLPDAPQLGLSQARGEIIPLTEVRPQRRSPPGFVPLDSLRLPTERMRAPVLVPVLALDALADGSMRGIEVDGARVLLCRLGNEVFAFRNTCPGSVLPLDLGRLDGSLIVCPWHECRFDARSGRRLDGGDGRLEIIPVSLQGGTIALALAVAAAPAPRSPSATGR